MKRTLIMNLIKYKSNMNINELIKTVIRFLIVLSIQHIHNFRMISKRDNEGSIARSPTHN